MPYETVDSPRDPSLKEEAQSVAAAAKAGYQDLREEVKQDGDEVLSGVKQTAYETAETQQHRIGENLEAVAIALKASVESLKDQGQDRMADYWRVASDGVDNLAKRLKDKPLPEMWMEAERYVREQPGFAFGGAVAAGFLLSRFLKSSSSPDAAAQRPPRDFN